eukprot:TRINITY_DN29053_c0_g1_i1.p1 TRINITY_DN29053_c0_g1~~TRINITY_DN29053_c0_g1_i1.p1  ORF type:complete len:722 (-),score=184.92 TRINITY_DN29053_c0_g1_i1:456-2621(-)
MAERRGPSCPRCPMGGAFLRRELSDVPRPFGDIGDAQLDPGDCDSDEVLECSGPVPPGPLGDVLDWLRTSETLGPLEAATFAPLPADELTEGDPVAASPGAVPALMSARLPKMQSRSIQKKAPSQTGPPSLPRAPRQRSKTSSMPHIPAGRHARGVGTKEAVVAAAAIVCNGHEEKDDKEMTTFEDEEDEEWAQRQQRTGTVGRLVRYGENDKPTEDLLLRGGNGRHVVVAAVCEDGPAAKAGVKAGDRLVSVDGHKDFLAFPADSIRDGLMAPCVLVFLGFVGKLQAEVRLSCEAGGCGLNQQTAVVRNTPEVHFTLAEEKVLQSAASSLFFTVAGDGTHEQRQVEGDTGSAPLQPQPPPPFFELQQPDAHGILRWALNMQKPVRRRTFGDFDALRDNSPAETCDSRRGRTLGVHIDRGDSHKASGDSAADGEDEDDGKSGLAKPRMEEPAPDDSPGGYVQTSGNHTHEMGAGFASAGRQLTSSERMDSHCDLDLLRGPSGDTKELLQIMEGGGEVPPDREQDTSRELGCDGQAQGTSTTSTKDISGEGGADAAPPPSGDLLDEVLPCQRPRTEEPRLHSPAPLAASSAAGAAARAASKADDEDAHELLEQAKRLLQDADGFLPRESSEVLCHRQASASAFALLPKEDSMVSMADYCQPKEEEPQKMSKQVTPEKEETEPGAEEQPTPKGSTPPFDEVGSPKTPNSRLRAAMSREATLRV